MPHPPPSPGAPSRIPASSAAFLHHLHTDPSSHHITLASTVPGITPRHSPQASPVEPPSTSHHPTFNRASGSASSSQLPTIAGPSMLGSVGRVKSKRGRPKTAPSRHGQELGDDRGTHSNESSPDLTGRASRMEENLPNIGAAGDCIAQAMGEEVEDGLPEAMDMMELSADRAEGASRTSLIGRAGSLAGTADAQVGPSKPAQANLSWPLFAQAYAHGLFDPNKQPNEPTPSDSPADIQSAKSSPGKRYATLPPTHLGGSGETSSDGYTSKSSGGSVMTVASSAPSTSAGTSAPRPAPSMASSLVARKKAYELEHLPNRPGGPSLRPDKLSLPSYSFAAATVRMASTFSNDLSPLAVPSPERELTDPMSSIVSLSTASTLKDSASSDPGSSRFPLHHSMSSALGTNPYADGLRLPTIQASPLGTPNELPGRGKGRESGPKARHGLVSNKIPAATAPLEKTVMADKETDYFGSATASPQGSAVASGASSSEGPEKNNGAASGGDSSSTVTEATPNANLLHRSNSTNNPRSTSPLPIHTLPPSDPPPLPPLAYPPEIGALYEQHGWLPAPVPPDEMERRRALYRFNILHTAADLNFNRIAHMAKLVFNPKIVLIALIDGETQWYKSQSGLGAEHSPRITSFCSHAILARSDEPFVVLDTLADWRFEKNPNVVMAPYIRFYAGAPLRTADGHNIGSLCIIDDKPRSEFTPRSRLILKEFAAVAMREMELWRDKLQLRVRDRIQTSMERFTRECLEADTVSASNKEATNKMEQVYARAAQLVCSTIGLDGCVVLDIGQIEMVQVDTPEGKKTTYRADPYSTAEVASPVLERSETYGPVNPFPVLGSFPGEATTRTLSSIEHEKLSEFLSKYRDGRIFESVAPMWIRYLFPSDIRYGMVVPIFGVDKQPFAMICAYTTNKAKQFLEGYELQFLRAIGVIILSAVLRRRMVMADKTKSILISSVSHELRTPLHGILAAAELLGDTPLDNNQLSFLKTVQTCGNSLIETVNHVLDFTKLSGTQSSMGPVKLGKVNLAALVEQTVEGCWIGQRARFFMGDNDIGSFYAPPPPTGIVPRAQRASVGEMLSHVETVVDIDLREKGWMVRCEKGGLRRVLMNLVGNSFKFTKDGYVQVSLREMPHDPGSKIIPVEMTVIDTGKGIGRDFLKDQLFHPFSQENPLQTGTGLGLAIVNSIVRSESVNGKVDVWSAEGMGTEIKVTFDVEAVDEDEEASATSSSGSVASTVATEFGHGHSVSFVSFIAEHKGHMLSCEVLSRYVVQWKFEFRDEREGDILVVNDDVEVLEELKLLRRPIILLAVHRTVDVNKLADSIRDAGGFCRIVYKPVGPTALKAAMSDAVEWLEEREATGEHDSMGLGVSGPITVDIERPAISRGSSGASHESDSTVSELSTSRFAPPYASASANSRLPLQRRRSEENEQAPSRPRMAPRGMTYHAPKPTGSSGDDTAGSSPAVGSGSPTSTISTISLADGGVMLKAAAVPSETPRKGKMGRVMVVEDNIINRRVLGAFLKKRGFEYAEAVDGRAGVDLFDSTPPNYWDVILMDISMPVMNGHQATRAIRRIEAARRNNPLDIPVVPPPGRPVTIPSTNVVQARVKIFALTGLATQDDKREAFGSGVDGYLVKPVSLSSLDTIFKKIGF
ncbi:hypothetical protein IAT38_002050 [Cryptococcus sp. DSM 104549]